MKKLIPLLIFIGIINIANAQFFIGADLKGGFGKTDQNYYEPGEKFSHGANAIIGYEFLNHFTINTGFSYYKVKTKYYSPSSHLVYIPIVKDANIYSIPLKLSYFYQIKKIRLFANIGLVNLKVKAATTVTDFKSGWHLGYIGELGIGYWLKSNLCLTTSMEHIQSNQIKFTDKSLSDYNNKISKVYFYGLNIGVRYYL